MSDHFRSNPSTLMCSQTWHGTTVVINCSGVVDMLTVPELTQLITTALDKHPSAVVIDLTETTFLASCGMSTLIDTQGQLPEQVPLVVVADGPVTRRPLELVGLGTVLAIRSTLDVALQELAPVVG